MELENIYELMERFRTSGLAKLELREADTLIKMEMPRKTDSPDTRPGTLQVESSAVQEPKGQNGGMPMVSGSEELYIRSPIVGTFYAAPEEGAAPYVRAGDRVRKGAVVCIVEAMKMMNEINAPCDCVIEEICAVNASPVGFEDPLFRIREL